MKSTGSPHKCGVQLWRSLQILLRDRPGFRAAEFHNYLGRARGSLVEVETAIMLAQNLQYVSPEGGQELLSKSSELGKMLNGLASSIRAA